MGLNLYIARRFMKNETRNELSVMMILICNIIPNMV